MRGTAAVIADARGQKWASADSTDEKIGVFGDTALVTGIFTGMGTDAAGKPLDDVERCTDTWVKMAGGQCVANHRSIIKKLVFMITLLRQKRGEGERKE